MKAWLAALLLATALCAKDRIGEIDFFGYKGLDVERLRAAIPYRKGDALAYTPETFGKVETAVKQAVRQVTGRAATDVAFVCCDAQGDWETYIGVRGGSSRTIRWNRRPKGAARLPGEEIQLYDRCMAELQRVVRSGGGAEDNSAGYALSPDPALRATQLAMREYAVVHEALLRQVLASSDDKQHRVAAAAFLGYANQSPQQIAALVEASHDADDGVRNNATRALGVLASSGAAAARQIPAARFIEMLSSGTWKDRNKAEMVLIPLTAGRDRALLAQMRGKALDALIEMARWQCPDHAEAARRLLGRIAGIEEARLDELLQAGRVQEIVDAAGAGRRK